MNRKEKVNMLGEYFGVKPKYLGAPSFAYEVKTPEETYTINKSGEISTASGELLELEDILGKEETINLEIELPLKDHNSKTLTNLANMIFSKQPLIRKALEIEEDIVSEDLIEMINEIEIPSIEEFKKELEITKNKVIEIKEETIMFKLYKKKISPEKLKAHTELIALISEKAKELKFTSPKQSQTENEKYAFRTWLLRLGMIGEKYKDTRRILLENLSGNGAFRKPKDR